MSARKRLAGVLIFLSLTVWSLMAVPVGAAYVLATRTGDTNGSVVWDPATVYTCSNGFYMKVKTWDFFWFDSTGTSTFYISGGGVTRSISRTGEHDGFTWQWNTTVLQAGYFRVTHSNMWGGGTSELTVGCR